MTTTTLLSEFVFLRTYAATLDNGRKETRSDTIERVAAMHRKKFPNQAELIDSAFALVHAGKVLPSMRAMQFAGTAIERESARQYNCSYAAITDWKTIADLFYLLLCGTGVGYSVQARHISKLPKVKRGASASKTFTIADDREGWCDSILALAHNPRVEFNYTLIRAKGASLSTGGTSSGPEPLQRCHEAVRGILKDAVHRKLKPLEVHDILCYIADAVIVGGVRRAAMISLFDPDCKEMLSCKSGPWWEQNPQRGRANNSAVVHRDHPHARLQIVQVMQQCFDSNAGEPGIYLTNCNDYGINPCAEIALKSHQFCNLTEVNVAACKTPDEFRLAVIAATVIGTLQATYTDFHYISPKWTETTREESLLGVSLTGQALNWDLLSSAELLEECATTSRIINARLAQEFGINKAARITTVKPSGSASAYLDITSGIHAAYAPYYLRRVRCDKTSPLGKFLIEKCGLAEACSGAVVEQDKFTEGNVVLTIPYAMPEGINRQTETPLDLLGRVKHIHNHWIVPGHARGKNTHNVSVTVEYRKGDEEPIMQWMLDNMDSYSGLSFLPYDGGSYVQAPFEEITQMQYLEWLARVPELDFSVINWKNVKDTRQNELACSGGSCEII